MQVFIDGQYYAKEDAKISVFDHGFLYGDGVFEGIRVFNDRVLLLEEHIDRLFRSAKIIMLEIPYSKAELAEYVLETVARNDFLENGYIRLVATRGIGDLGLDPFLCKRGQIVIIVDKIKLYPEDLYINGLSVITSTTRRNLTEALPPQVKSLNYLNNILAKIEAVKANVREAIMLSSQGFVSECTGDNIFIVNKGKLMTPGVFHGALDGITKRAVMDLAQNQGIEVEEATISLPDVYTADECFLTGTAAGVIPVVEVDLRSIGDGKPGPISTQLKNIYDDWFTKQGIDVSRESRLKKVNH